MIGLAYVDISTGEFVLAELAPNELEEELARIRPAELIVAESRALEEEVPYSGRRSDRKKSPPPPDAEREEPEPPAEPGPVVTTTPDWVFDYQTARQTLLDHFGVQTLDGFGCEQLTLAIASGAGSSRYLAEISETIRAYRDGVKNQSSIAERIWQLDAACDSIEDDAARESLAARSAELAKSLEPRRAGSFRSFEGRGGRCPGARQPVGIGGSEGFDGAHRTFCAEMRSIERRHGGVESDYGRAGGAGA